MDVPRQLMCGGSVLGNLCLCVGRWVWGTDFCPLSLLHCLAHHPVPLCIEVGCDLTTTPFEPSVTAQRVTPSPALLQYPFPLLPTSKRRYLFFNLPETCAERHWKW